MRLIFEPHDDCYYFEVILTPCEVTLLKYPPGLVQEFTWESPEVQDINVCVRIQKESRLCLSAEEKELPKDLILKRPRGKCVLNGPKNGTKDKGLAN